jgi:hypothetical protein
VLSGLLSPRRTFANRFTLGESFDQASLTRPQSSGRIGKTLYSDAAARKATAAQKLLRLD